MVKLLWPTRRSQLATHRVRALAQRVEHRLRGRLRRASSAARQQRVGAAHAWPVWHFKNTLAPAWKTTCCVFIAAPCLSTSACIGAT